ncbi:MAG: LPS-assembly protein LptD [Proteobacteria bacterium]|nr:MAG: LPS-assembly protein LptD [Pseudomonadota bacterium]
MFQKKSFSLFLFTALSCGKVLAIGESSLNSLSVTPAAPLVCGYDDSQWYQKSGPDFFGLTKVESQTMYMQANDINGQYGGTHVAQGNVIGYKGEQTFFSDWLIYDQLNDRASMGDNVYLTRQFDSLQGQWADYFLDLNKGKFTQARAYYGKENLSFTGDQINVQDKAHATIDNGYMTSCNPNDPAWYVKSDQIKLDYTDSQGAASNATMYFESIPIFHSPYMTFPLGQRRSGWLTPNFGGTSTSGFMASEAYYWNMAPNYDMTITPEVWARQGIMVADQFRYMTESNVGSIYTEQLPSSWGAEQGVPNYRWYWSLTDTYTPAKYLTMGYNYNQVSDNNYFNDFGNFYSVTDSVNLDQSAYINYAPQWGLASIKLQNYQTLYPLSTTQTIPIYAQYPMANFNVNPQNLGAGFKGSWLSSYGYFYSPDMQSGQRLVAYPSVTYPMQKVWGSLTPKLGLNSINYDVGNNPGYANSAGQYSLNLPVASIDGSLYFDRPTSVGNTAMTQTFEPRLYYLYIPAVNQANLPDFDTATATYNYNQLFSENQFTGSDRLNAANDITIGGTSRLINDANGNEIMKFNFGYRYFISQESNSLYGTYTQYPQLYLPTPNMIAELTNQWNRQISTFASFQYDTTQSNVDYYSVNLKWNPDAGKVLNVGFSYQYDMPLLVYNYTPGQQFTASTYENQYAVNISGQWPLYKDKIYIMGRTNYDFTMNSWLNFVGGLQYNGGCYNISAVYQQFIYGYNYSGQPLNQQVYMLNFNFKGIGDVGSGDPTSLLNNNIQGYQSVYSIMQDQTQY